MDPSLQPLLRRLEQLSEQFRELRDGVQKAVLVAGTGSGRQRAGRGGLAVRINLSTLWPTPLALGGPLAFGAGWMALPGGVVAALALR